MWAPPRGQSEGQRGRAVLLAWTRAAQEQDPGVPGIAVPHEKTPEKSKGQLWNNPGEQHSRTGP
ncbi:hypothetical protein NDU88_004597, partial [Pleurodeles waltl]